MTASPLPPDMTNQPEFNRQTAERLNWLLAQSNRAASSVYDGAFTPAMFNRGGFKIVAMGWQEWQ
jgi:hypothetical protein